MNASSSRIFLQSENNIFLARLFEILKSNTVAKWHCGTVDCEKLEKGTCFKEHATFDMFRWVCL